MNKDELERFLNKMDTVLKENYSVNVNRSKTKVMVCGKNVTETLKMRHRNEELQEVDEFCYLGSKITKDGRSTKEIKSRIAQAKRAFYHKKRLLTSNKISLRTKKFLKAYVWSVALYGCEAWTIGGTDKKRPESLEMWCYRRMLIEFQIRRFLREHKKRGYCGTTLCKEEID
jgi:glutaredoxin-related protein